MKGMSITIIDVAKKANVSISTVSKYLNGGNVKENNRIKIAQAIQTLHYVPSRAAQGLKTDKSHQIGFLISGLDSPYIANMTEDFVNFSQQRGYHLLVTSHHDNPAMASRALSFLIQQQVDGILYLPLSGHCDYLQDARDRGIPLVAIDRTEEYPCDTVTCNSCTGSYQATEHLIRTGHRRIGIIGGNFKDSGCTVAKDRLLGYLRALEDYRIPGEEQLIQYGDFSFESGYRCMQRLLDLPQRPDAVFVTNYHMMLGAVCAINNNCVRIPDELSFITFDDLDFSEMSSPPLTAIRQPAKKIVRDSIDLLIRRMQGDYSNYPLLIRNTPELIVRASVKNIAFP